MALPVNAATGQATSVRTVSPLDSGGALKAGFKVTRHVGHGICQRRSYMTGDADRCSSPATGAVVLDPCWPTAQPKSFVCQAKPWVHKVVQVHVAKPLSGGPGSHRQSLPWGMRIGTKVRCLLDPGSVRRLYGHALLYHCSRHRDVFGPLRRNGSRWKAHVYRGGVRTRSSYRSLGWRPVRIAWYGAPPPTPPSPSPTPSILPTLTESASPSPAASP